MQYYWFLYTDLYYRSITDFCLRVYTYLYSFYKISVKLFNEKHQYFLSYIFSHLAKTKSMQLRSFLQYFEVTSATITFTYNITYFVVKNNYRLNSIILYRFSHWTVIIKWIYQYGDMKLTRVGAICFYEAAQHGKTSLSANVIMSERFEMKKKFSGKKNVITGAESSIK